MYRLLLTALLFVLSAGPACAYSEADHQYFLKTCPEYQEADRELNAAWKKLKSVCGKEEYAAQLAEQRAWLKVRDGAAREAQLKDEAFPRAAARVIMDRVAVINLKILKRDRSYVTFSTAYDVPNPEYDRVSESFRKDTTKVFDVAVVSSRPVWMNPVSVTIKNRDASPAATAYVRQKAAEELNQFIDEILSKDSSKDDPIMG